MFRTILTPVQDIEATKAVWTAVLGEPTNDTPYYVGWTDGDHEVGLTPAEHQPSLTGPTAYWHTDDIEAATRAVVAAGGTEQQPAADVGGGRLVGLVADSEGHVFGLIQDPA